MEKGEVLAVAEQRLWALLQVDADGCWIIRNAVTSLGYSRLLVQGEMDLAHRWAYRVWVGPIPEGRQVNHHCDKRACVRPSCLYAGTQSQNIQDCSNRGRHPRNRGGAKLTLEQVHEIRASIEPQRVFMEKYGITRHTVSNIRHGRTWGGV